MPGKLQSRLVNESFGDPGVLVEPGFGPHALLLDMGSLAPLAVRQILRVATVLVSHCHMDHFAGFDHALRLWLGRPKRVRLFGPPGFLDAVEHRLRSYVWNLAHAYDAALELEVAELDEEGRGRRAIFGLRGAFARRGEEEAMFPGLVLVDTPALRVRCTTLDHGIPCLAFAVEEPRRAQVRRTGLEALGLVTGPWLAQLKRLALEGADPATPVTAAGRDGPRVLPLDLLRREILAVGRGASLAYVTDCVWSEINRERIVGLASGVDTLFIEAPFLERDRERARARHHLTALQAGALAREADVRRVVPFHFSPRHAHEEEALRAEVEAGFRGLAAPRH